MASVCNEAIPFTWGECKINIPAPNYIQSVDAPPFRFEFP